MCSASSSQGELASIGLARSWWGIVVAFLSGWASIFFLLRYLRTHTTHVFIYYRYVLGALMAVLLVMGYVK